MPIPNLYEGYFRTLCRQAGEAGSPWERNGALNQKDVQHPRVTSRDTQPEKLSLERVHTAVGRRPRNLPNLPAICAVTPLAGTELLTASARFQQLLWSKRYVPSHWRLYVGTRRSLMISGIHWNSLFEDFKWACARVSSPSWPLSKKILVRAKWGRINPFCYRRWTFIFHFQPALEQEENLSPKKNEISLSASGWQNVFSRGSVPALLL